MAWSLLRLVGGMIESNNLRIQMLHAEYNAKYADMQQAQAQIVSDNDAINSTKYYGWIPFVGTSVAVGEIIAKKNDIE